MCINFKLFIHRQYGIIVKKRKAKKYAFEIMFWKKVENMCIYLFNI